MLNLLELEQLAAFAAEGTLFKAAEKLHISQPTITRTMQHLEEDFGVSLFRRTKNHIALNETGWKAVEYAERILKSAEEAVEGVRSFDRSLHTITVSSCAPAPLWELLPALTRTFPDMTISSSIKGNGAVLKDLQSGSAVLGVLPQDMVPQGYSSIPLLKKTSMCACLLPMHLPDIKSFPSPSSTDIISCWAVSWDSGTICAERRCPPPGSWYRQILLRFRN